MCSLLHVTYTPTKLLKRKPFHKNWKWKIIINDSYPT